MNCVLIDVVPTQCSVLPTPWAGDIYWSCWKLRSEDKETLGYLQQASLLRMHCVLLQSKVLRQWYIVVQGSSNLPSTYFYAQFGILHKKKAGWKRQDAHKFKKSRGVKTFEQNGDVYIFLVLPKYHFFFSFSTALQKLQNIVTCFPEDKLS